ncbi:hypothetical protein LPUS_06076 [Lasallia pustulata]|uniref:Uncharacterized protein n=1 Tax=Lasallia pustulata TaxID=136370 RepID=A0A1W5D0G0_9LECA|nr:hypothetical protein LPUS_06076 [Lasallia pustulata]
MSSTSSVSSGLAPQASNHSSSSLLFTSAFDHITASASNVTSYMNPTPMDLLLAVPRMVVRAGSFAFVTIPERIDHLLGIRAGGSVIAEATGQGAQSIASAAISGAQGAAATAAAAAATEGPEGGMLSHVLSFQHLRNFSGVFSYLTSKWALCCFTVAIILNRTQIYASARRHISLGFPLRLALRIVPLVLFLWQTLSFLQAIRCQTSPDYSVMRYGKPGKRLTLDFAGDGGPLYYLSSRLLFWQNDQESCLAVSMITSTPGLEAQSRYGSFSLLWPLFQSLCLGQFIETLSCAVQGRAVMTETGMSIFEHSLAFAEAEAMLGSSFGFSPFGSAKAKPDKDTSAGDGAPATLAAVSKNVLFDRGNTPPEVLLMGLISCLNNLTSHTLAVFGLQGRFRLINTGIWGLCFMGSFVWGFFSFSPGTGLDARILRFPTVCIVGFIPHLLLLLGICISATIYLLALILSALSPPPSLTPPRSWRERFRMAHENLQANGQLSTIRISRHEDFYTALLKIGFTVLTAASEAVYLNEGRRIGVSRSTWLEDERLKEIEQSLGSPRNWRSAVPQDIMDGPDTIANWVMLAEDQEPQTLLASRQPKRKSGYSRERSTKILKGSQSTPRTGTDGVGALQRGNRYYMAWEFFTGIFWLITGWLALGLIKILNKVGSTRRPAWLRKLDNNAGNDETRQGGSTEPSPPVLDFWVLSEDGKLSLPNNNDIDVEAETKKRLQIAAEAWGREEESNLDSKLYDWFKYGGWWGERDESGDYEASEKDDDTTSVISVPTTADETDWEPDGGDDGRRTPTQREPYPGTEDDTPLVDSTLDVLQLARLLDPPDVEQRHEAQILAHHLASNRPLTRAQFQHAQNLERAHVLTSTRYRPAGFKASSPSGKLTPKEEAELLEHLIISRRAHHTAAAAAHASSSAATWREGAEGLGAGGPQYVSVYVRSAESASQ